MQCLVDEFEKSLPPMDHPLRKLGVRLTELLDDDHWAECERLLLEGWEHDAAALARAAQPVAVPHAQMTEEIDLHRLQQIESAALLALGLLWLTERNNDKVQAAFKTLRNALGGNALRKGIASAIDAGYEADHPPGADWWAGKKDTS